LIHAYSSLDKVNILQIIATLNPRSGGPSQAIQNLAPQVIEQGHGMEVVCLDDANSDFLVPQVFPYHALGAGRGSWAYHRALRPWLNKNLPRFDAVVLNGLWQYSGYLMSKLARQNVSFPYFIFPHGMLDPWFQQVSKRRLKAIRNWFYWKFIEQHVIRQAEGLLFTCAEEMRVARETFRPYQPKRQIDVGFGVAEPPAYHPGMANAFRQKCPGVNNNSYFLFLGRVDLKKGIDILIEAYAAMLQSGAKTGKDLFPSLVIAGPGLETAFGRQMQQLALSLCPSDSVFWPGMLIGDAKWGALYHSEAFVLTSHQENFGIAVAEAMGCGKAVLISNKINIWREIEQDKAGLFGEDTQPGAEKLLARWLRLPTEDKMAMARAAKASFEKRFGVSSAARSLVAALGESTMPRRTESLR
jgi:glycosyltransferase involved in cell wall biosynthesis